MARKWIERPIGPETFSNNAIRGFFVIELLRAIWEFALSIQCQMVCLGRRAPCSA